MNFNISILLSGGQIVLFAFIAILFFRSGTKTSRLSRLYRCVGILYVVLLLQTCLLTYYRLTQPWHHANGQIIDDFFEIWRGSSIITLQAVPFVILALKEYLRIGRVNAQKYVLHTSIPMLMMVLYEVLAYYSSEYAIWVYISFLFWLICYLSYYVPTIMLAFNSLSPLSGEVSADKVLFTIGRQKFLVLLILFVVVIYVVTGVTGMVRGLSWVFELFAIFAWTLFGLRFMYLQKSIRAVPKAKKVAVEEDSVKSKAIDMAAKKEAEQLVVALEDWLIVDGHLRAQNMDRKAVAQALETNHVTLARLLKVQTGMSLSQFVNSVRLKEAERLLLSTSLTIEEVYYNVGYQSRSTFARAFQTKHGMSATEWRIENRK